MDQEKLNEMLEKHKLWIDDEEGGERADLRYANLRHADLSYANLLHADLSYADLRHAGLSSADLSSADLSSADLSYANLSSANLSYANLSSANLSSADLRSADLSSAKNLILLPVADYRGYTHAHAVKKEDGDWLIRSGCRSLLIEDAKNHWGDNYKGERDIGDMYLYAIEWLENKLAKED